MVTDRPYRKAMAMAEIVAEIIRCSGSQFDPAIAQAFADLVRDGYEW
jgi:HD-GYP domain-containing protein (c-di-GMP phosphodiesterase class II)